MRSMAAALVVSVCILLGGCATYSRMTFESTLSEAEQDRLLETEVEEVEGFIAQDFGAQLVDLYERGYRLIGYAKFVSPLKPGFAVWNAKTAAKDNGASLVMLAEPQSAKMGQYRHLFTYWREPLPDQDVLFGAFYGDSSPDILGMGGCGLNLVTLQAIADGSPAQQMGLRTGDVIVAVDNQPVAAARQLDDLLVARADREVNIRYVRDDESRVASGRLGPFNTNELAVRPAPFRAGVRVTQAMLTEPLRERLKRRRGLYVNGIHFGSPACASKLRSGDLILAANGQHLAETGDFLRAIEQADAGALALDVLRGGVPLSVEFDLGNDGPRLREKARRLAIAESELAQPPWIIDDGSDFTWAAWTIVAVEVANAAYQQYLIEEQRRIDEYNRLQAQQAARKPIIVEGRRGSGYRTVAAGGGMVSIDASTATMLRENPGLTVTQGNRRGGGFAVYDAYGSVIKRGQANSGGGMAFTAAVPPDMTGVMQEHLQQVFDTASARELGALGNPYDVFFERGIPSAPIYD